VEIHVAECPYCDFEAYGLRYDNGEYPELLAHLDKNNPAGEARHDPDSQRIGAELNCERHISWDHCPANGNKEHDLQDTPYRGVEGSIIRKCSLCGGQTGLFGLILDQKRRQ